jgi:hypothetical protein
VENPKVPYCMGNPFLFIKLALKTAKDNHFSLFSSTSVTRKEGLMTLTPGVTNTSESSIVESPEALEESSLMIS